MKSFRKLLQTPAVMLHSLSSNLQEMTAEVAPFLGAVAAHQELAHAVDVGGQSMLHASVTSGGLIHGGLAVSFLPAAAGLNAAFELGLGFSKICLALLYSENDTSFHQHRTRKALALRGVVEMLGSIAPGTIAMHALASASAPLACWSLAISSYTKAITKAWDYYHACDGKTNESMMPAILSALDGTGWLLLSFGIPAGGALVAFSFLAKRYLSTGTLAKDLKEDACRIGTWCSTFGSPTSTNSEQASLQATKKTGNYMPSFRAVR